MGAGHTWSKSTLGVEYRTPCPADVASRRTPRTSVAFGKCARYPGARVDRPRWGMKLPRSNGTPVDGSLCTQGCLSVTGRATHDSSQAAEESVSR